MAYGFRDTNPFIDLLKHYSAERLERDRMKSADTRWRQEFKETKSHNKYLREMESSKMGILKERATREKEQYEVAQAGMKQYIGSRESEVNDTINEQTEVIGNNTEALAALDGFKLSASGKEDSVTVKKLPDGRYQPVAKFGEREVPLTSDPFDDNSTPITIGPENLEATKQHLKTSAEQAIKGGLRGKELTAYTRSVFKSDPKTGDTVPATPEEQMENIKTQGFMRSSPVGKTPNSSYTRSVGYLPIYNKDYKHVQRHDLKGTRGALGSAVTPRPETPLAEKKPISVADSGAVTIKSTAKVADVAETKVEFDKLKKKLFVRGSKRYLEDNIEKAKEKILKAKTKKERLKRGAGLFFSGKITLEEYENMVETDTSSTSKIEVEKHNSDLLDNTAARNLNKVKANYYAAETKKILGSESANDHGAAITKTHSNLMKYAKHTVAGSGDYDSDDLTKRVGAYSEVTSMLLSDQSFDLADFAKAGTHAMYQRAIREVERSGLDPKMVIHFFSNVTDENRAMLAKESYNLTAAVQSNRQTIDGKQPSAVAVQMSINKATEEMKLALKRELTEGDIRDIVHHIAQRNGISY